MRAHRISVWDQPPPDLFLERDEAMDAEHGIRIRESSFE
jgi:hypothetical protein